MDTVSTFVEDEHGGNLLLFEGRKEKGEIGGREARAMTGAGGGGEHNCLSAKLDIIRD